MQLIQMQSKIFSTLRYHNYTKHRYMYINIGSLLMTDNSVVVTIATSSNYAFTDHEIRVTTMVPFLSLPCFFLL